MLSRAFTWGLLLSTALASSASAAFQHPGLLHTQRDFERMRTKVAAGLEPWTQGFKVLTENGRSGLQFRPNAQKMIIRGRTREIPTGENYSRLYVDTAGAYQLALRWHVTGDDRYADTAVRVLNAWAGNLTHIDGSSDKFLASGIYGYQLANAGEMMRGYAKWPKAEFQALVDMMLKVFYPMNHGFLVRHNGQKVDHYWANWDLANMNSMLAIGVLADRQDIYDEAIDYFKNGAGNGAIKNLVWKLYDDGTGQVQEVGRDQGHSMMDVGQLGTFCQMAYNQGDDLFAYDNRALAGFQYIAKYNLGHDVQYTPYTNSDKWVNQTVIASGGRGNGRPVWELVYNHYVVLKGIAAPYITEWAKKMRPEGGGGNYGSASGGYDQLGFGTLTFSLGRSCGRAADA